MKVKLQTTQSDCLITCAAMVMEYFKYVVPVYILSGKMNSSYSGNTTIRLRTVLSEYGFLVDGYKLSIDEVAKIQSPAIAHVKGNHFVTIEKIRKGTYHVIDPALGKLQYSESEFSKIYSGVILIVKPDPKANRLATKRAFQNASFALLYNKKILLLLLGLLLTSIGAQIIALNYSSIYAAFDKYDSMNVIFAVIAGMLIVLTVTSYIRGLLMKQFSIQYEEIYGNTLMERLLKKDYRFFSIRSNGDLLYRINSRTVLKDGAIIRLIPALISIVTIIVVGINLFVNDRLMGLLLAAATLTYLIIQILISIKTYLHSNYYIQKTIDINSTSENIIRSIETIKVLGVTEHFINRWKKENKSQAFAYGKVIMMQNLQDIINNIFSYLIPILLSLCSLAISKDGITLSQIAVLPLLFFLVQNTITVSSTFSIYFNVGPTLSRTQEVLDTEFLKQKERVKKKLDCNTIFSLNNLSYSYSNYQCLKNISIDVKYSSKIAVLGLSGSGKSTLLKILANLLTNYDGECYFDESNNNSEAPVYLDQETSIIDGTILENVLFGREISQERLLAACQLTGLDNIVHTLPQQWFTPVSQGRGLSKGQEQRICLTRCLLNQTSIYLLDEATSNIDARDEERIISNLFDSESAFADKTILISTHKLNIVNYVDKILFISDKHVHFDTHANLYMNVVSYRELFNSYTEQMPKSTQPAKF